MSPTVELATSADVDALLALRRSLEDWMAQTGVVQWPRGSLTRDQVAAWVADRQFHVVRDELGVVASVRLLWSDPEFWADDPTPAVYVHGLMVDRRAAGSGLGRGLVEWAADRGRAAGVGVQRLDCRSTNPALRAYYEGLGFVVVGHRDFPTFRNLLLERPLDGT